MKKYIKEFIVASIILGCFVFKAVMLKLPLNISYFVVFGWPILEFFPLVIALIIVTYKYLSIQSIIKTLVLYIPFQFAYLFLYVEGGISYLILQSVLPILKVLVFFLIIKWVCKCKIKINKVFLIIGAIFYLMYFMLFLFSSYIDLLASISGIMTNNQFFAYLKLLDGTGNILTIPFQFVHYAVIIVGLVGMSISIPAPVKKCETEPEAEEILEIEGAWRCMGCGEYVPNENDRCECGYKR